MHEGTEIMEIMQDREEYIDGFHNSAGRQAAINGYLYSDAKAITKLRRDRDNLLEQHLRMELDGEAAETMFELNQWLDTIEAQHRDLVDMQAEFIARYGGRK